MFVIIASGKSLLSIPYQGITSTNDHFQVKLFRILTENHELSWSQQWCYLWSLRFSLLQSAMPKMMTKLSSWQLRSWVLLNEISRNMSRFFSHKIQFDILCSRWCFSLALINDLYAHKFPWNLWLTNIMYIGFWCTCLLLSPVNWRDTPWILSVRLSVILSPGCLTPGVNSWYSWVPNWWND